MSYLQVVEEVEVETTPNTQHERFKWAVSWLYGVDERELSTNVSKYADLLGNLDRLLEAGMPSDLLPERGLSALAKEHCILRAIALRGYARILRLVLPYVDHYHGPIGCVSVGLLSSAVVMSQSGIIRTIASVKKMRCRPFKKFSFLALHYAAMNDNVELAAAVTRAMTGPEFPKGYERFVHATVNRFAGHKMLKTLVAVGFNLDERNSCRHTPLQLAVMGHDVDAVEELLEVGADRNVVDTGGETLLHLAVQRGHIRLLPLLLTAVDVNARDKCRRTPLHYASAKHQKETVSLLLKSGADVNAVDDSEYCRNTPLDLAWTPEIRELLKSSGGVLSLELK